MEQSSRRVTDMVFSLDCFQFIVKTIRTNWREKLLDFDCKNL